MFRRSTPFAIAAPLSSRLGAVFDAWTGLLRGEATIPFADDLDVVGLEGLCPNLFLLGVFEKPRRFRLDLARTPDAPQIEGAFRGRFIDEVDMPTPMEFLRAQAEAAVESAAATVYDHVPAGAGRAYGRLVLPTWGEGQVSLLVGAVEFR